MYKPMLSHLSKIADNWICNIEGAVYSWNAVNHFVIGQDRIDYIYVNLDFINIIQIKSERQKVARVLVIIIMSTIQSRVGC